MHPLRLIILSLFLVLTGCASSSSDKQPPSSRMQGMISTNNDGVIQFKSCDQEQPLSLSSLSPVNLNEIAPSLLSTSTTNPFYADISASQSGDILSLTKIYRLGRGIEDSCQNKNFKLSLITASSQSKPTWHARANTKGIALQIEGQPEIAFPYLVEQIPDGSWDFSSDVNGKKIELWLRPHLCQDGDRVTHLSAELLINKKSYHGCGAIGGASSE